MDDPEVKELITEAIEESFGKRCPDFDPDCYFCKIWREYDNLYGLKAENEQLKTRVRELTEGFYRFSAVTYNVRLELEEMSTRLIDASNMAYPIMDPPGEDKPNE
jgi:hypothetical protein